MPHRYFTNELAAGRAALTGSDAHHLADVMRAKLGEEVVLCGPDGLEYLGTVTAIQSGRVEFTVTKGTTSKAEPDAAVTLFAGYPKQGKLEEVIRHSVELGVTEIVPFFSRYCVATPKKEDAKNERYNRIAAEAAKQAGRAMLPHVSMPLLNFAAVCDALQEDYDLALFFYEGGGAPLRTVLRPGCAKKIAIVTGSEGGFSVEEAEAAKAAGAKGSWVITKHLLPNCISVVVISTALQIPNAIFTESYLSFLGLGVNAPMPSLGSLASDALNGITSYPYRLVIPAIVISLIVLSLNLFGDGLRDAFDPKLNS